ncbi:MAG: zinc-ribbon domain-containing protein [Theionarchaea archaeon]|nr:zinc-ribbon domain-containing protein [Theionarchaea archaeon]
MKKISWLVIGFAVFLLFTSIPATSPSQPYYISVDRSSYCIGDPVAVRIFIPGTGEVTVWDHMTNGYTQILYHHEQSCRQDSWIVITGIAEGPPGMETLEYEAYLGCCSGDCYEGGWVSDSVSFAIQDCGPCEEWLYVNCNESRYDLYIDGQYVLTEDGDGQSGIELEEGTHQVQLKKDGCETVTRTVQIVCGHSTTLDVTMNCDPCENVTCGTVCRGNDLWRQECVNGSCFDDQLVEANSSQCGYNPCENVTCGTVCRGNDLWRQECVNGSCVDSQLVEANSSQCGYDPCENHCTNQMQDCGEYGVDCGGGCPFTDSDSDGVEDCLDLCGNSRCNRVDAQGCETDVDNDGVLDCEDDCPNEAGDAANNGCPPGMNLILILGSIGAVAAVGGGLALWGLRSGRPSGQPQMRQISRPPPDDLAMRQEAAERIARETAQEVAQKKSGAQLAEGATKKAGTKLAEGATKKAGTQLAEGATKKAGTQLAEAGTKKAGTQLAEGATKKAGTQLAEAATKKAGTQLAETAAGTAGTTAAEAGAGAGITGMVAKKKEKEMFCPNCGEKMPSDSKFCSKCGHEL